MPSKPGGLLLTTGSAGGNTLLHFTFELDEASAQLQNAVLFARGVLSDSGLGVSQEALCTVFAASLLQDSAQVHSFRGVASRAWDDILSQWVVISPYVHPLLTHQRQEEELLFR